jgi:uncharacterized protein YndB with AHSA1/START domain
MQYGSKDTAGREQRTSLLLEAPLGRVWEVWTKPEHIRHWWGPNGFTNTIEKMEVEPGGEWLFTMHGPDGRAYPNRTIFREVVPCRKLVHEHVDPNFMAIIEFEARDDKTLLHWYKLYETEELFEKVEKEYKASEGFKQTIERLQAYLDGNKNKRG